jgi:regulator of protease activity HflC (stomatin/prohibitin superfamily)
MPVAFLIKMLVVLVVAVLLIAIAYISNGLKIVPESDRLVVFRLGKCIGMRGPGIVGLIPFVDRGIQVKIQQAFEFAYANLPALDNQNIACTVTVLGRIIDPEKSILNVPNLEKAVSDVVAGELAVLTLEKTSPALFVSAQWMEDRIKEAIARACPLWGFEVSAIKVTAIRYS